MNLLLKGNDELGSFECVRRYSAFRTLRKIMRSNWPGVYIPALPEKKIIVKKIFLEQILEISYEGKS